MAKEKGCSVTTSSDPVLAPGTVIKGKWKRSSYVIQRLLGRGANGTVYLVKEAQADRQFALKMGKNTLDLQSEINVLTTLQSQGTQAALQRNGNPSFLFEVDDVVLRSGEIPFYVMRYVKGDPLHRFVAAKGPEWYGVAGTGILNRLADLHQAGWVFGDLKPQNILVNAYGEAELIDYGGVSLAGRSVKQFTEWYDRGFWNAGSRNADSQYDLFAFALLTIHILESESLKAAASRLPQLRNTAELTVIIRRSRVLRPYAEWLLGAVRGEYSDTRAAARSWSRLASAHVRQSSVKRGNPRWLGYAFTVSLLLLAGALWIALR
ncbi:serine/threonine-protein kinase [Paenibacillus peoriae]|jgi:serine/threonine-protein kinase|uniref:Serine/threonine-protein kinase n=1 Tax=Paenibacillus peoriae TaxID=59893 RepID=A0ABU1QPC9_9BACL|nr:MULTISPECIES: serine/threonine protein kinase [Paenibacillus]MBP1173977.1 serine/threonine-protein kinase [Paenibacillus sp. PvR133]MDR6781095.1 serine/threonine-protein kinase [Paenibacillus peoriae]